MLFSSISNFVEKYQTTIFMLIIKHFKSIKLVAFLLVITASLGGFSQDLFPYLQAPQSNGVFITWKTDFENDPIVEYGLTPDLLETTATGSASEFFDGGYVGTYFYNTVQLVGLTPNTKYYYKVKSDEEESAVQSFKTLPLPGEAATDGHIRFLIMGDNQIATDGRYDSLVSAAKRKVIEKYGGDPSDNIALTFMVGDQVDLGNLTQYENIHLKYNRELSGQVPIQTTVGNHETYGALGMSAYYSHFYLDHLTYQGISSGTENYYALQAGNVLFISLSSEHTGATQYEWLEEVMNAADEDETVDWVLTFSHRPYEAEQYVGDISGWVKTTAVPFCMESEKYLMHVGAHHHIYSRGQFRDKPVYNIISGGTAWDQLWGMSTEQDFDYIQKTISNWCYQIMDVDVETGKVDIETYSIGSPVMFAAGEYKNNELVDEFHRYIGMAAPVQPTILTDFGDSLELPVLVTSSDFETETTELLNTTHFQISQTVDFDVLELDILRDYENLFGQAPGEAADSTQDLNAGVDILTYEIPEDILPNGFHYIRLRHRDRNLEWSDWSETAMFKVYNSEVEATPSIVMDSTQYPIGATLQATYANGPGNPTDWVGIYEFGDVPGPDPSTTWAYCSGMSGVIDFSGDDLGPNQMFFTAFFELDGYTEIADRDTFYYGQIPEIDSDTNAYPIGEEIFFYLEDAPAVADSMEILKVGYTHGVHESAFWGEVDATMDTIVVTDMEKGYYSATYYFQGEYQIGEPFYFSVGDTITELWIDKPVYDLGENIVATWTDAPGIVKDWLGIYNEGDDPNVDPLLIYTYFDGIAEGEMTLSDTLVPETPGNYFIVMFTDDSYTEVSNREFFVVEAETDGLSEDARKGINIYPNPVANGELTTFSSDYPIEAIYLSDLNGRVVYRSENVNNQQYTLLTHDLPKGIYILEIQSWKRFSYKIVVE